jgi:hypothetical protein
MNHIHEHICWKNTIRSASHKTAATNALLHETDSSKNVGSEHHQSLHKQIKSGIKAPTATNIGINILPVSSLAYGSCTFGSETVWCKRCFRNRTSSSSESSSSSSRSFGGTDSDNPGKDGSRGTSKYQITGNLKRLEKQAIHGLK